MPLAPPTGLPQASRRWPASPTDDSGSAARTSDSLRGFWVASIVGGRREGGVTLLDYFAALEARDAARADGEEEYEPAPVRH